MNSEKIFEKLAHLKTMDVTDLEDLKSRLDELLTMNISIEEAFLDFQRKRDEIEKHVDNEWCESYYLMTTDLSSEDKKKRFDFMSQELNSLMTKYNDKLNRKSLEANMYDQLGSPFNILKRNQSSDMELFSEKNIELSELESKISSEITEIQGKQLADWRGKKVPLSSLGLFRESNSRDEREEAFKSAFSSHLSVADTIDEKFERLLAIRHETAKNAGFEDYVAFRFKEMGRFDWGPRDCFEFHAAVKKYFVPLYGKILEEKKTNLNLDRVKWFDRQADHFGRDPLVLYEKGQSSRLIEGTGRVIEAIDPELYQFFQRIKSHGLIDIESRENKAPGGFMVKYPVYNLASVFYNGSGQAIDFKVLLHELGHCFHFLLGTGTFPYNLINWTAEVGEAGAISMEYMGLENAHYFLPEDQCARIKQDKVRAVVDLMIRCAVGDEFQHWLYNSPGHSSLERAEKWQELLEVYYPGIDKSEHIEQLGRIGWQFSQILKKPFYLIDYAISGILAISIWQRYKEDPKDGLERYKYGCSLVGTKTVPEIYEAFGTTLDFGDKKIAEVAKFLEGELF